MEDFMKIVYPVCFYEEEEGGYSIDVPDLLGCCTQADSLEEAIEMAQDAALGWLTTSIEDGEDIPAPSKIEDIKIEKGKGVVSLILLDLDKYMKENVSKRAVKKTLTIPAWLNEKAEKIGINFSQVLQEALLKKILKAKK